MSILIRWGRKAESKGLGSLLNLEVKQKNMARYYNRPHYRKGKKILGGILIGLVVLGGAYVAGAGVNGWEFNPAGWSVGNMKNQLGVKLKPSEMIAGLGDYTPAGSGALSIGADTTLKLDSRVVSAIKSASMMKTVEGTAVAYQFINDDFLLDYDAAAAPHYSAVKWKDVTPAAASTSSSSSSESTGVDVGKNLVTFSASSNAFVKADLAAAQTDPADNYGNFGYIDKVVYYEFLGLKPQNASNVVGSDLKLTLTEGVFGDGNLKGIQVKDFAWTATVDSVSATNHVIFYSVLNNDYSDMKFEYTKAALGNLVLPDFMKAYFTVAA